MLNTTTLFFTCPPNGSHQRMATLSLRLTPLYRSWLFVLMLLLTGLTAQAQKTWTGSTTDWNTAANWSPMGVPIASDDVVIPSSPANQPVLSTTAVANTVEVQSGASLSITAAGSLTLNGSKTPASSSHSTAFYNNGLVDISGQLIIGNTASVGNYGIYNVATLNNNTGGEISIDGSSKAGLETSGTFNNAARLSIGANAGGGNNGLLIDSGTFSNLIGGEITIDNTSNNGVYGNGGSFFNYAKITIGVNGSVGLFALQNNGVSFGNSGCSAILVANAPIGLQYFFSNSGTIIENSSGNSQISTNTGIVQNLNGGAITIGSGNPAITTPGNIWKGCTSTDWNTASNWLTGTVPTASDDVVIPSSPANQPVLSTTAVANTVEIQSGASLSITAAGSLTLNGSKNVNGNTMAFYNGGQVDNSGQLIIGNTASVGNYGIYNAATFNNHMGGQISIDRSSSSGLFTSGGSTFNNAARLFIGANAGVGNSGIDNNGTFINQLGGEFTIDNTSFIALYNDYGIVTNYARITIGASGGVSGLAISNQSITFNNSGCSAIINVVADAYIYGGGDFTNSGTIIESASGNSGITNNTGIVQNLNGGTFSVGSGPNQPLSLSTTNATTCSPADGLITISGLHASTTYTLSYTVNGASATVSPNPTSNASGQLTVSNLAAGSYALTLGGTCVPLPLSLSAILSGPASPTASLVSSGSLTCAIPSVTLTASGGSSYAFSGPGLSQSGATNTAVVSQAGTYVVIVTAASGCTASASTTVYANTSLAAPSLQASATTTNQPISVTATGCAGTINWNPQGGTGSATGSIYTFSAPGNYSLSASCTLQSCTSSLSTPISLTILPSPPASFALQGVTLISCQAVSATERQITFTPQYTGLNGQTIVLAIAYNSFITTQPGPYSFRIPTNMPLLTLIAQQGAVVSSYNFRWLDACQNGVTNRPPTTTGIVAQAAQLGQNYSLGLATYFSDPDGQALSFRVSGLPSGLNLTGSVISGVPTASGVSPISVTAVDPGGLSVTTSFVLTINPLSTPNRAPTTSGIGAQSTQQGKAYSLGLLDHFSDPDGQALSFRASGLPSGLNLTGSVISGTPSATGTSPISVTAVDPGGLSVTTSFVLTVSGPTVQPTGFALLGVNLLNCQTVSATERQITFTPQYTGLTGGQIILAFTTGLITTQPGPYTLKLSTDQPLITLIAQQGSVTSSYNYRWLNACLSGGRSAATEEGSELQVSLLGNPVVGQSVEVEIRGVAGQRVNLELMDLQGRRWHQQTISQASSVERVSIPVGTSRGLLVLQVSSGAQTKTVKVLKIE